MDVRDFVGIPFVAHGREWDGLDCWGLVWLASWHLHGVRVPSYGRGYTADAGFAEMERVIAAGREAWCEVAAPQPGDVAILRLRGRPIHCGLCVGHGRVLHTQRGVGSIVDRLRRWRVEGYYRYSA